MPVYYSCHELMMNDHSKEDSDSPPLWKLTFDLWKDNFVEDNIMAAKIWVPLNFVIFGAVPLHLRIPRVAGVGTPNGGPLPLIAFHKVIGEPYTARLSLVRWAVIWCRPRRRKLAEGNSSPKVARVLIELS